MKCLNPNCNSKECPVCEECSKLLPYNWQIMMSRWRKKLDYTWNSNEGIKGNRWYMRIRWFFDIKYSKYNKFLENLSDEIHEYDYYIGWLNKNYYSNKYNNKINDSIEYCNNLIINEISEEIRNEFQ